MSVTATRAAMVFARAWTRLYTCGLDDLARSARRLEIESHVWETVEHARHEGANSTSTGLRVVVCVLAGVVDDVLWRAFDAPSAARSSRAWMAATAVGVFVIGTLTMLIVNIAGPVRLPAIGPPSFTPVRRAPPGPPPPPPAWHSDPRQVPGSGRIDVAR